MKRLTVWMGVRSFFENSTVCLKIDAKYPVLMGQALRGFRVLWWLFRTVFPLVVRLWLLGSYRGLTVSVLQPEINMASLMPYSGCWWGFSCSSLYPTPFGVVDQASTESLILAQDERWRRA